MRYALPTSEQTPPALGEPAAPPAEQPSFFCKATDMIGGILTDDVAKIGPHGGTIRMRQGVGEAAVKSAGRHRIENRTTCDSRRVEAALWREAMKVFAHFCYNWLYTQHKI
jgi:hypothetical protein